MEEDPLRPKLVSRIVAEVLPDTKHHQELKLKREEQEKIKRDDLERLKKEKEQLDEQMARASEAERQKAEAEIKKKAEDEKRKKEIQEVQDKLEGRLQIIKMKIKENDSPYEYSFTDISLDPASLKLICDCLKLNSSLMILHISRKNLSDEDGEEIGKMLVTNKRLEKVDLEGNQLGLKTAKQFAIVLRENKTLRYLDLENNQLCYNTDNKGVIEMAEALTYNIKLLGLNIANNNIDQACIKAFIKMLQINLYLIELDITFNYTTIATSTNTYKDSNSAERSQPSFNTELVLEIMNSINRNRKKYEYDRLSEWRERKQLKEELDGMTNLVQSSEEYKKKKLEDEVNRLARQAKREAETNKKVLIYIDTRV
jgi:hypothetical protein